MASTSLYLLRLGWVALRRPSLNEVFFALTGHPAEDGQFEEEQEQPAKGKRKSAERSAS